MTLIYSALPHYRQPIIELMQQFSGGQLNIYCGPDQFDPTLKTDVHLEAGLHVVKNHYLLGRRLLWQSGVVRPGIRANHVILEINPRILNVWVTLILRRLLRRPTSLWGHAWSKRGSNPKFDRLRQAQRRLAEVLVVYTATQQRELQSRMPRHKVLAAPNALYTKAVAGPEDKGPSGSTFVFSGRLIPMKRPRLLLEAFAAVHARMPRARLVFVGDGPERAELQLLAAQLGVKAQVDFLGYVADPDTLRSVYADAVASVSPGAVGLALTQSLWFGVPMIVADDEPHGPEVEAAVEGATALFFTAKDSLSLQSRLLDVWTHRDDWRQRRSELSGACQQTYSAEAMARQLLLSAS